MRRLVIRFKDGARTSLDLVPGREGEDLRFGAPFPQMNLRHLRHFPESEVVAKEALGREILEALKWRTGAEGKGYVLWGLTSEELIAFLASLAEEVPALVPRLPLYAKRIRQGGFTLLVLLLGQEGEIYLVGTEAPLELLPRGVA